MSDTSQGDGWWIASDGKWYPPEATPGPVTPPPPTPTPPPTPPAPTPTVPTPTVPTPTAPPVTAAPSPAAPAPTAPPTVPTAPVEPSKPVWKRAWFIILLILVVVAIVAVVASGGDSDEPNDSADQGSTGDVDTDDIDEIADTGSVGDGDDSGGTEPTGTDLDDFVSCAIAGDDTLVLEVVNNSSETSSYFITIVYRDDDGTRLGDETQSVSDLRPGERTIEEAFSFDLQGTQCEAADVDRFSSQSAGDELDDANACEITGRDAFDDLAANVSVTNNSSETSDYFLTVAFVRDDGTRVGTGSVSINAVAAGETAPGDVFTVVEAEASLCEVVAVQRFANN